MKDNLENILKDKLDNFEMPYEASAWSQMEAKLDAKTSPTTSRWYWLGGAAVIAILSTMLVMTWENSPSTEQQSRHTSPVVDQLEEVNTTEDITSEEKNVTIVSTEDEKANEVRIEYAPEKNSVHNTSQNTQENQKNQPQTSSVSESINSQDKKEEFKEDVADTKTEVNEFETIYTKGVVPQTTLCYNGELVIRNNSINHKVKARVNGRTFELLHNEQAKVSKITAATQVEYLNAQNEVIGTEMITLHAKPNIFFRAEANLFNEENGLPVIQISNTNEVYEGQWFLDGTPVKLNNNDEIYCYTQGTHTLNYEVTDLNGCTYSEQKKITVDKDFNLMANNALNPESIIPENRSFLPESLKRMNVPFTFRVIDPSNGGVMYETNDVTQPWDGIDIRTGQLAKYNQTFIWQVSLEQSIENAPKTYRGDVVLVQKR